MPTATTQEVGYIYLLHFDPPYKHARHYIGWARNLEGRLAHHEHGTGANLCRVVKLAGARLVLSRVWKGTRDEERALKRRKDAPSLCPHCNPQSAMNRATHLERGD